MTDPLNPVPSARDFEYDRRFFCTALPGDLTVSEQPSLIIQSYYVHEDNYALRVRVKTPGVRLDMDEGTDPYQALDRFQDRFAIATVTVKGPSLSGTRYEAEREIDPGIAVELIKRGGKALVKTRYTAWIGEDGWNLDVFGGDNFPLICAEAKRNKPVTNLLIPDSCTTEITDDWRFSNDGLAEHPYSQWKDAFLAELERKGPRFHEGFGVNRTAAID